MSSRKVEPAPPRMRVRTFGAWARLLGAMALKDEWGMVLQEVVVVYCMVLPAFAQRQRISMKVLTQAKGAILQPRIHVELLEYCDTEC